MKFYIAILFAILIANSAIYPQTTYTTGFESPVFTIGNINGQNGWGYFPNSPTKGIIESAPAGSPLSFGTQSLAIRTNNVDFFGVTNHMYSATIDPAGETGSTSGGVVVAAPYNIYSATFYYQAPATPVISTLANGRFAELNPSSKGSEASDYPNRYAQVRVVNSTNTTAGKVLFEIGWYTLADQNFSIETVAQNLNWGEWYRITYDMTFCDGLNGTSPNDTYRVSIYNLNDDLLGSALGSTWETAWKTGNFGGGNTPRAVNGFDFWSRTGPNNALVGYVDNFSQTVSNVANPCLAPTAASVTVAGRVVSSNGRSVSKAFVKLTNSNGETRIALTNPFGYYRFYDVEVGTTYILSAVSKQYRFDPQVVTVLEEMENFDFIAK